MELFSSGDGVHTVLDVQADAVHLGEHQTKMKQD